MSQFIISCKESRIETNRSFYGCFELGPFEPSQSLTIANTLRRTLLSEIYGLAIVSVEIEGASHEYSSLPGVHESVLDILLNLKEIVLKKSIKNFTPQIGYLRARGPGVVTGSHLRLPPFIQCVDPDQYIATLSHNGFLNIKFVIQYGNKWLASGRMPDSQSASRFDVASSKRLSEIKDKSLMLGQRASGVDRLKSTSTGDVKKSNDFLYNLHFKKRRLFLKKLKEFGFFGKVTHSTYIKMFSKNLNAFVKYKKKRDFILKGKNKEKLKLILKITNKYPGINLKNGTYYSLITSQSPQRVDGASTDSDSQRYPVDSVGTTNISETGLSGSEVTQSLNKTENNRSIKYDMVEKKTNNRKKTSLTNQKYLKNLNNNQKKVFFNVNSLNIDSIFNPITKVNYIIEVNDFKIAQNKLQTSFKTTELYETLAGFWPESKTKKITGGFDHSKNSALLIDNNSLKRMTSTSSPELTTLLDLNQELSGLTKENIKHNIILEIWTNGSLHPRDALNQAFKNLLKTFLQLKNVQPIGLNNLLFNNPALSINAFEETLQVTQNSPENELTLDSSHKKNIKRGKNTFSSNSGETIKDNTLNEPINTTPTARFDKNEDVTLLKQRSKLDQILLKKIRMGVFKKDFLETLAPLNETTYLSTYISPKIRNYYLNKSNLFNIIQISIDNDKGFGPLVTVNDGEGNAPGSPL